jgi:LacI family transcriptional regulator
MQQLLALDDPITAVCASADVQAYGAWAALRDAGLDVPKDMSIVGYDNLKLSRYLNLTTIDQQMHRIGQTATQRVLARMEAGSTTDRLQQAIVPELIVRGSTSAPKDA